DVLVGVNLLREGLDLPEVSLVAILDADKEGFLRNNRSLTQTIGRAARNINGRAILYADKITKSMASTIEETERRREKQIAYNQKHGKVPVALVKKISRIKREAAFEDNPYVKKSANVLAKEDQTDYGDVDFDKLIAKKTKEMEKAAKDLDFIKAAALRDEIKAMQEKVASE
ncbi:MAG: helicase-related protein, partial [Weeksellaceae bacterium]